MLLSGTSAGGAQPRWRPAWGTAAVAAGMGVSGGVAPGRERLRRALVHRLDWRASRPPLLVRSALSLASRSLRHRLRCGFTDLVRWLLGVFLLCWLALPGSVVPTYASSPSCFYAGLFTPRGQGEKGA